jgi:hypothetical protein
MPASTRSQELVNALHVRVVLQLLFVLLVHYRQH